MNTVSVRKSIADSTNDVSCTGQSVVTCVLMPILRYPRIHLAYTRPTTYGIFARYLCHSTYEMNFSASFRTLICSEYQRNLFTAYNFEGRLRAPNVEG